MKNILIITEDFGFSIDKMVLYLSLYGLITIASIANNRI